MSRYDEKEIIQALESLGQSPQDTDQLQRDLQSTRSALQERFRQDLDRPQSRPSRGSRWIVAALVFLSLGLLAVQIPGFLAGSSPVWAEVAQQFASVPFSHVVIYQKKNASADAQQWELWMGRGQKTRLRMEQIVLFGQAGQVTDGFNYNQRRRLDPREYPADAETMLKKLGQSPCFDLNTLLSVFGGTLKDVTPLVNREALVSADLVVFDVQSDVSPEWLRIWALRASGLPVRARLWDPRYGECMDMVFTYSHEQADDFFDARAYEQILQSSVMTESSANLAYALLRDAGGRDYVPRDIFVKEGYHMPIIREIGMTEYGAVWVIADKALNSPPNGRSFYGFRKLEDDLGRVYERLAARHRTAEDRSTEIFVPTDYPFDTRRPSQLRLSCMSNPDTGESIGSVSLDQWQPNQLWPEDRLDDTEMDIMLTMAWKHCRNKAFESCDRIMDFVRQQDSQLVYTHRLNRLELRKLILQKQFKEAAPLVSDVWDKELEAYLHPRSSQPQPIELTDVIIALAGQGQHKEARDRWQSLKETPPDLSPFPKRAQQRMLLNLKEELTNGYAAGMLVQDLRLYAGLTIEEINDIMQIDVRHDEDLRPYSGYNPNQGIEDQRKQLWHNHLLELQQQYRKHPLAEGQMEWQVRDPIYTLFSEFALPEMKDYHIHLYSGSLANLLTRRHPGRIRFDADINDIDLKHYIVAHGEISPEQRLAYVLAQYHLELVEQTGTVTVWTATQDDRELPRFNHVRAPVSRLSFGLNVPGSAQFISPTGLPFSYLLQQLSVHQNVLIDDQTKLDAKRPAALECPLFEGPVGKQLAIKWYEQHFGITFTEGTRQDSVWVVRKKGL